jgi:hypothetical protein
VVLSSLLVLIRVHLLSLPAVAGEDFRSSWLKRDPFALVTKIWEYGFA